MIFKTSESHSINYSQLSTKYNLTQFNSTIKILRNIAYNCVSYRKYPLLQTLQSINKLMLINEFQCVIFAYIVEINKWNINDSIISSHSQNINNICSSFIKQSPEYNKIVLYLLLCAYTAKYYSTQNMKVYESQINLVCDGFSKIFQNWIKKYASQTLKMNPRKLNTIYKKMCMEYQQYDVEYDYNSLVDNLLIVSPSYCLDKSKDKQNNISSNHQIQPLLSNCYHSDNNNNNKCHYRGVDNIFVNQSSINDHINIKIKIQREQQSYEESIILRQIRTPVKTEQNVFYKAIQQNKYSNLYYQEEEQSQYDLLFRKKISTMSTLEGYIKEQY